MPPYRPDRIYGTMASERIEVLVPPCSEYAMCAWGFTATYHKPSDPEWEVLVGPAYNQGFYWLKYINRLCRLHSTARP